MIELDFVRSEDCDPESVGEWSEVCGKTTAFPKIDISNSPHYSVL